MSIKNKTLRKYIVASVRLQFEVCSTNSSSDHILSESLCVLGIRNVVCNSLADNAAKIKLGHYQLNPMKTFGIAYARSPIFNV